MEKNLSLKKSLKLPIKEKKWLFSVTKCQAVWLKNKNKYEDIMSGFHVYNRPIAAFNENRPLYLIGFKKSLVSNRIKVIGYYPNVGYVSLYEYKQSVWKNMVKEQGKFIIIDNVKITIGEKGFEISENR